MKIKTKILLYFSIFACIYNNSPAVDYSAKPISNVLSMKLDSTSIKIKKNFFTDLFGTSKIFFSMSMTNYTSDTVILVRPNGAIMLLVI